MSERLRISSTLEKTDDDCKLTPVTIRERSFTVLSEMNQPLHWQDIQLLAETDGHGKINPGSLKSALSNMVCRELLIRIGNGVYSLPEFAAEDYTMPKVSIEKRLDVILRQAGEPLEAREIGNLVNNDGYGEVRPASIRSALGRMVREGKIIRIEWGLYCLPEFTNKQYELPERPIGQRLETALWQAGRPLHWRTMMHLANEDGYGIINPHSIWGTLNRQIRKGSIVKVDRGIYSLPEFSYASSEQPHSFVTKAEITGRIVDILDDAGGSSDVHHIYGLLAVGNLEGLTSRNTSNILKHMTSEDRATRKITRTAEDAYCLFKSTDEEYEAPKLELQERFLAVLQVAGRPLHWQEMLLRAEKDGYGKINKQTAQTKSNRMAREGLIIRVAISIYSLPEFVDEYYETPKPTIETRIMAVLAEASQPLHWRIIYRLVNTDGQKEVSLSGVGGRLVSMTKKGIILRVAHGIYSLPEFVDG